MKRLLAWWRAAPIDWDLVAYAGDVRLVDVQLLPPGRAD